MLQELGHIPEPGETVELTEFDPDGPLDDPVHWQATVIQMDGRRIDLLELTELGRRGESEEGGTLMGSDLFGVLLTVRAARRQRVLRRRGVRADLGAPRPPRSARRTGQEERRHRDPGR